MHIEMPEKGSAEASGGGVGSGWGCETVHYKLIFFPFSIHFNTKNRQFYSNVVFKHILFENFVFITVMMGH